MQEHFQTLTLNPWVVWKDLELVSPCYSIVQNHVHQQDVLWGMNQSDYLENHHQEIGEWASSQLGKVWA